MKNLQKIFLTFLFLSFAFIGCGGGSSSGDKSGELSQVIEENDNNGSSTGGEDNSQNDDQGSTSEGEGGISTGFTFIDKSWSSLGVLNSDAADAHPFMTISDNYAFAFWFIERKGKKTIDTAIYDLYELERNGLSSGVITKEFHPEGFTPVYNTYSLVPAIADIDAINDKAVAVWQATDVDGNYLLMLSQTYEDESGQILFESPVVITEADDESFSDIDVEVDENGNAVVVYRRNYEDYYVLAHKNNGEIIRMFASIGNVKPSIISGASYGNVYLLAGDNVLIDEITDNYNLSLTIYHFDNSQWHSNLLEDSLDNFDEKVSLDYELIKNNNSLIAVSYTNDVGVGVIYIYESSDNVSWSIASEAVITNSGNNYNPIVGISNSGSKFILYGYTGNDDGGLDNIMLTNFSNKTWSEPVLVSTYGNDHPDLMVDEEGNALLIYEDLDSSRFAVYNNSLMQQMSGMVHSAGYAEFRTHKLLLNSQHQVFMIHTDKHSHGLYQYR